MNLFSLNKHLKVLITLCISLAFIYLSFRKVDAAELLVTLKQIKFSYLIFAILFTFLSYWIRALRWRYLLIKVKSIKTYPLFASINVGFMANNLLPLRMGEIAMAIFLAKIADISKITSMSTIFVARLLDILGLLFISSIVFHKFDFPSWVGKISLILLIASVFVIVILYLISRFQYTFSSVIEKYWAKIVKRNTGKLSRFLNLFLNGISSCKNVKIALFCFALSVLVWLSVSAGIYSTGKAFNLSLSPYSSLLIIIILALGIMIPSAPGFAGTFEYFCISGLKLFDIPETKAASFSLVYHATQFFPVIVVGILYLWVYNLGFKGMRKLALEKEAN